MSLRSKKLGFEYIQEGIGLTGARFTCSRCPEELYLNNCAGKVPEIVANIARNKGWVCDAHHAGRTVCPDCQGKKTVNDPESELKKFKPKPMNQEQITVPDPKLSIVPPSLPVPTPDQRMAIRNLLDKHFDDSAGRFLDGMSDRAIGEKVGIGAAVVKQIREAAYGPENYDPEIDWLQKELERLDGCMKTFRERLDAVLRRK